MIKNFFWEWREWGFRTALNNLLISFTYEFIGAKSMKISYSKRNQTPMLLDKLQDMS
jgi:hypothetical protein